MGPFLTNFTTYLLLLFWLLPREKTWAAPPAYKEFTINNGLPHTDALCTVQDNNGFLWFATLDGLCRYDGINMIVYRNDHSDTNSISNNRINTIELDNYRNGLWIGTQGGGLNFFDLVSGMFHRIKISSDDQPIKEVISIKITENNTLWVSKQNGLFVAAIDKQMPYTTKFIKIPIGKNAIVQSIYQDKNKGMWLGTLSELYYKPVGKKSFVPIHTDKIKGIYSVIRYNDTHILAGTSNGLFMLNIEDFGFKKLNDLKVTSLLVDKSANIWAGTLSEGLFVCNNDGTIEQSYPFGSAADYKNIVKNIFKDRSSSIFVSTLGGGIKVINENNFTFKSYPQDVTEEALSHLKRPLCFFADDHSTLYIGTRRKGLAIYDRVTNSVKFYNVGENIPDLNNGSSVTAIFKDNNKNLWIGDGKGLYILERKYLINNSFNSKSFKHLPNPYLPFRVNKIVQDKIERTWVVTSKGLFCYNKNGQLVFTTNYLSKEYSSLNTDFLTDIILREEDNGNVQVIWLATKSGISVLKIKNADFTVTNLKKFTAGPGNNDLFSNWISLLHEDQDHNIWAGTIGGGLSRIIPGKNENFTFQTITTKDGLLTNDIETLLEDFEGNFWIGSIGLTKYNPKKKTFSYYDANDGLQSNSFKVWAAFKRSDGEMIFGGINGFNIFYPQNITKKTEAYTPQLTNLVINNIHVKPGNKVEGEVILKNSLPYTSEITLNHTIKNFELEFASIHSQDFQRIVYRYRLLNYDKQWTYTNSEKRFVNYAGLPPGDYIFEVAASGGEGIWNSQPLTLKIHIIPSFWASKYGYLLYAFIIGIALFLQRRYTLIRLDVKHKLQIDKTRQEQEIKSYEDKMQFFTNISHELRTPLTLITSPIEQLVKNYALPDQVNDKLTIVHKNAERLRHLIDQVLDIRKLELDKIKLNKENVSISEFLNNLFIQFNDLVEKKDIKFSIDVQVNRHVLIDAFKMEQVLINLLSNAIKFTPENGEINLKSYIDGDSIVISLYNSGSKLNAHERTKIFEPFYQVNSLNRQGSGLGLTISKHLVELHEGTIDVNSGFDKKSGVPFTCFTIKLPASSGELFKDDTNVASEADNEIAQVRTSSKELQPAIVIAEDNGELRKILEDEFMQEYKVYTAANGREALKIIRKVKPVLIISDVMMPELDGIALCKAVKNDPAINDIPIMMLTAKNTEQSRLAGLEVMADDYISKPFSLKELHLKVKNMVTQRATLRRKLNNEVLLNPTTLNVIGRDERILKDVMVIIENNIDNPDFSVEQLCKEAAISRPVLYRKIKELTGMSIQIFILDVRLKRAAQLLKTKGFSVSEVMFQTGFSSPSYFNRAFKNKYHSNPAQYNQSLEN